MEKLIVFLPLLAAIVSGFFGKIIGNNNSNNGNHPKLIVYSDANASDNIGGKSQELANRLNDVGNDSINDEGNSQDDNTDRSYDSLNITSNVTNV